MRGGKEGGLGGTGSRLEMKKEEKGRRPSSHFFWGRFQPSSWPRVEPFSRFFPYRRTSAFATRPRFSAIDSSSFRRKRRSRMRRRVRRSAVELRVFARRPHLSTFFENRSRPKISWSSDPPENRSPNILGKVGVFVSHNVASLIDLYRTCTITAV